MKASLDGCYRKLDRANEHIKNINDDIIIRKKFGLPANCVRATTEFTARRLDDPSTFTRKIIFRMNGKSAPLDTSYTIQAGEAIHQLRSVLDHLVYQLVIAKTNEPPTFNSAFPIVGKGRMRDKAWQSAADYYTAQAGRLKNDISVAAETEIHRLQPYQRGAAYEQDPLWVISELDNAYKHRLLLLAVHRVTSFWTTIRSRDKEIKAFFDPDVPFEHGAHIGEVPITDPDFSLANADVTMDNDIMISVAFADGLGARHGSVLDCLSDLHKHVLGIVNAFRALPEFGFTILSS